MTLKINIKQGIKGFGIIQSLFFFLLGFPLSNGSSIALYSSIIVGAILCFMHFISNKKYPIDNFVLVVLGTFVMGELLALVKCSNVATSLSASAHKIAILLVLYPVLNICIKSNENKHRAMQLFLYGATLLSIIVLINNTGIISIKAVLSEFATHRLAFYGIGPNVAARLFCIAALYSFYKIITTNFSNGKFLYVLCFISLLYAMLLTVSVSGLVLLVIGVIWIYSQFCKAESRIGKLSVVLAILLLFIVFIIVYNNVSYIKQQVDLIIYRQSLHAEGDDLNYLFHGRMIDVSEYLGYAINNFIFGCGYGCSSTVFDKTLHLPILAALIETGILGMVSIVIMYGKPFFNNIRMLRKRKDVFVIISLLIILGDMIQPNPNYIFTWFAILLPMFGNEMEAIEEKNVSYSINELRGLR